MPEYKAPEVWSFAPFVLLLLAIAIFPLVHRLAHFWEKNRYKLLVSATLAALMVLYYAFLHNGIRDHEHEGQLLQGGPAVLRVLKHAVLLDYVPFIILLFSLYTISGGILLEGDIRARPRTNCVFLGAGAILASFIGTTGASMLLIRPILRTNSERKHTAHTVIFFIFMVSNIGGCLTPLGDPPLFLGYLRGVPFWWTLNLFPAWLFANGILLSIYFIWDSLAYRREERADITLDSTKLEPLSVRGRFNFVWLLGVVACVALVDTSRELPFTSVKPPPYTREVILLLLAGLSWITTPGNAEIRERNGFTFGAITEVAFLFIGIFICMQAPVEYLQEEGKKLGIDSASGFFWATGSLSSFLDNAPTYVVFYETAKAFTAGLLQTPGVGSPDVVAGVLEKLLLGVSLGAVFMGANTYIGNGPNFMVKTIAEQSGVKMPSFFGYMLWSVGILIPCFLVVTLLFFR